MDLYDLDKDFEQLLKKFPQARRELVEECGEKMYQKVLSNISQVDEKTGNLRKGVKKVVGSRGGYSAVRADFKIAPHTHLVENGHKIVRNGKVVGWVSGKHMYRNALNELANELEQSAEQKIDKLVGDIFG
ncbi:MAG: hypothetical protein ACLSH8_12530 [Zhenhengia sp.]|uniref:hypothetical protein n=1 Tax=Zhenhengia sp. TaxID=2944208 RepID=UPI003995ECDA